MLLQLVVYPIVSLAILLIGLTVLRPMIVSRNRILCLALSLATGVIAATGFYVFGGGFIMGAAHMDWPYPLFMAFYIVWLAGLAVVPIVAAWLTYRRARGRSGSLN